MDHTATLQEHRLITAARYSQSCQVRMQVMSVPQALSGTSTVNYYCR